MYYDPDLPIRVAADASTYGLGAVLSHVLRDGTEHPIAYVSRTLTLSEKNYTQVEIEALAIVFGVRKFHQYIYGRRFTLVTDHNPLLTIFGPKTGIPSLAAARMQRWSFLLSAYQYDIIFKPTVLPQEATPQAEPNEVSLLNLGQVHNLPIPSTQVQRATRDDPFLSKVYSFVRDGWPGHVDNSDL